MLTKILSNLRHNAFQFILLFGFISMFADMTYEGARSITGAYLAFLGANAAAVGFIAGFGELIGYGLRFFSGYLADRTQKHWLITIIGYVVNLTVVPLLAFTHHTLSAAILIILERAGKAIRTPARDAMLSHAGQKVGMGLGFGLHEALDQFGAMVGPLIVASVLFTQNNFRFSFAVLAIPAFFSLALLACTRWRFPQPRDLAGTSNEIGTQGLNKTFWLYLSGTCFVAAGFADFPLIAYHFQKQNLFATAWIPIAYALAMGVNSIFSLILGHLYDRKGFIILIIVTICAAFFAPLVFLGDAITGYIGVTLWAIGIGAQQSLMRAFIGTLIISSKRASAYGVFNMGYGISWFLGSALMGIIYDYSTLWLVIFIMALQFLAVPFFIVVYKGNAK